MSDPIELKEHSKIHFESNSPIFDALKGLEFFGAVQQGKNLKSVVKSLGITKYESERGLDLSADYYVGISWLKEKSISVYVKPKIDNIDYFKLFAMALDFNDKKVSDYFHNFYHISTDEAEIEFEGVDNVFTPLLIVRFISVLKDICSCGLKKDYVKIEENLLLKKRGQLKLSKHLKKNVFTKKDYLVYCSFDNYTDDIPINQLLKRALIFCIKKLQSIKNEELFVQAKKLLSFFSNITDCDPCEKFLNFKHNKIFKSYEEGVRLANMILKHYGYSIDNISKKQNSAPPFWIDMPRLYEMYVYNVLQKESPGKIQLQVDGYGETVDFIKQDSISNERWIIDAKYKPKYQDSNGGMLPDIREICGYARDNKIRKKLGFGKDDCYMINCLIVYPENSSFINWNIEDQSEECCSNKTVAINQDSKNIPISRFSRFYKRAISIPTI